MVWTFKGGKLDKADAIDLVKEQLAEVDRKIKFGIKQRMVSKKQVKGVGIGNLLLLCKITIFRICKFLKCRNCSEVSTRL